VPEEVTHLFERGVDEIVDIVPVVRKNAALPVEITDRRRRGDHVFEAAFRLRFRCAHCHLMISEVVVRGPPANVRHPGTQKNGADWAPFA